MKPFACLAPLVFFGACCMTPPAPGEDGETADMTTSICSMTLTDVSAWKDKMPGPDGANGNLVVVLEVENDGISRRFDSRGVSDDGTLMLDVVEWDQPAGIGRVVFRQKGISAKRVEVFCDGAPVTGIDVMTVY